MLSVKKAWLVAALAGAAALLSSCASPRMDIVPRFAKGEVRVYHLATDGRSSIDVPGLASKERTRVEATVKVEIVSPTLVRVTLTPTVFERDGRRAEQPPEERGDLTLNAAGDVVKVTPGKDAQPPLGGSTTDLGALLGATIRRADVRLGDRWHRERITASEKGLASSRIAGLRYVQGRRCAIVATSATAPSERSRASGGTTLRLSGTEASATETAFAFDQGLPVSIVSNAEGRYRVLSSQGGSVTVHTTTSVRLVSRTPAS